MKQLKPILMAILAAFGWLFALPTSAARRGVDKRGGFNFLPAFCVIFIAGVMAACVPNVRLPGDIEVSESAYDGTKHRRLEPGFVKEVGAGALDGEVFSLGLYTIGDAQFMIVHLGEYVGISSVRVNIDGQKHEFTTDALTEFNTVSDGSHVGSEQMLAIPKELIRQMVDGERVIVQLQTRRGVLEGDFSAGCGWNTLSACELFRKFLETE